MNSTAIATAAGSTSHFAVIFEQNRHEQIDTDGAVEALFVRLLLFERLMQTRKYQETKQQKVIKFEVRLP